MHSTKTHRVRSALHVTGALLAMGDAHMAQGDSELDGTGIETSITGQ